jgi:hypothetical protein
VLVLVLVLVLALCKILLVRRLDRFRKKKK